MTTMIIGKIEIELDDLRSHMNPGRLEIISSYLNGNKETGTIRQLIEEIAKTELTLYTDEEFSVHYLYENCEYNPVSEAQLHEFIKHMVIDPAKEVSPSYYLNFLYTNGKAIDPATGKDAGEVEFIPCLVEFSYNTMITYYIFEWYPEDGHCFKIED
jgi:hypothetical protein